MTSEQRMILRRHHVAYQQWGTGRDAMRAAIRIGLALGISQGDVAREFSVVRKTVWSVANGHRASLTALQSARESIARAERALTVARGRERAAIERAAGYGYPIPEGLVK
jgi:hypothetical protein